MRTLLSFGVLLSLTAFASQPSLAAHVDRSLSKETVRILNSLPAGKPRSTAMARDFSNQDSAANFQDHFTETQRKQIEAQIAANEKSRTAKAEADKLAAQRAAEAKAAEERKVSELRAMSGATYRVTDAKSLGLALKAIGQGGKGTLAIAATLPSLTIRNMKFEQLRILGAGSKSPVIQALDLENVSNVELRNLGIQTNSRSEAAARIIGASGIVMDKLVFTSSQPGYGGGLQVENSSDVKLSDSKFDKLSQAARFMNVANLVVATNTIADARSGAFTFANVRNAVIADNAMAGGSTNAFGLVLHGMGEHVQIRSNKDMSIALQGDENGRPGVAYRKVDISGNLLTRAQHEIEVGGAEDVTVENNSAARIKVGLNVMVRKATAKNNIASSYQMQSKEAARWTGATEDVRFGGNRLARQPVVTLPANTPANAQLPVASLSMVMVNGKPVLAASAR